MKKKIKSDNKEIVDYNDVNLHLKDNIIYNRLKNRPDSYYVNKNKKYTLLSFVFALGTFIFSTLGHQIIISKNKEQKTFLTSILGQTIEYTETKNRKRIVNDFIMKRKSMR